MFVPFAVHHGVHARTWPSIAIFVVSHCLLHRSDSFCFLFFFLFLGGFVGAVVFLSFAISLGVFAFFSQADRVSLDDCHSLPVCWRARHGLYAFSFFSSSLSVFFFLFLFCVGDGVSYQGGFVCAFAPSAVISSRPARLFVFVGDSLGGVCVCFVSVFLWLLGILSKSFSSFPHTTLWIAMLEEQCTRFLVVCFVFFCFDGAGSAIRTSLGWAARGVCFFLVLGFLIFVVRYVHACTPVGLFFFLVYLRAVSAF